MDLRAKRGQLMIIRDPEKATYAVEIVASSEHHGAQRVLVNGKDIGSAWYGPGPNPYVYPETVSVVWVRYQDRRFRQKPVVDSIDIADVSIPYAQKAGLPHGRDREGGMQSGRGRVDKLEWRPIQKKLAGVNYTYETALELKAGVVLATDNDTPFHWTSASKTRLTNHPTYPALTIPAQRPSGSGWEGWEEIDFLRGIPKQNWPVLLEALDGQFLDTILEFGWKKDHPPSKTELKNLIPSGVRQADGAEMAKHIGQCFDGTDCEYVALGINLLFTKQRGDQTIYIVDSPNYGRAWYIFLSREHAEMWAKREINYQTARDWSFRYSVHSGNWQLALRYWIDQAFIELVQLNTKRSLEA